jgi:anthranilate/para-aminobenzoate synthase component I
LYQLLVNNQPADFGGFIDFGHDQVLSRSPELFVEKRGQYLRSEPMKGTARRDPNPIIDQQILDDLLSDAKMQAENLMIVDLIRNDLSRVSESHSVRVSRLFEPRTLSSVHQVSSVIESTLRSDIDTCALIKALFPCGSVVGAPKAKAFELIQMLESDARGIYTGSLGLMEPNGDMTFSVAIRTIEQCGEQVVLGLGSGLVADSDLQDEWAECLLKGRFAGVA